MPEQSCESIKEWNGSADTYGEFVARCSIYRDAADALIDISAVRPGTSVVDLACGTGTLTECLRRRWPGGQVAITAIDASERMIDIARRRIGTRDVHFHCARAEEFGAVIADPVDRVICAAALWQFDWIKAISQVRQALTPGGMFCFSVPSFRATPGDESNTVLQLIRRERDKRGIGWNPHEVDRQGEFRNLCSAGFTVLERRTVVLNASGTAYLELLRIPVMAATCFLLDDLSRELISHVLAAVQREVEARPVNVALHWKLFALTPS